MRVSLRDTFRVDDDDMVRDRESVRVPLMLMDGLTDARARTTDARLNQIRRPSIEARDRYIASLANAWRRPQRDAAQPDHTNPPDELLRQHLGETDPEAAEEQEGLLENWKGLDTKRLEAVAQRARDTVHSAYCDRISNAWRQNRGSR